MEYIITRSGFYDGVFGPEQETNIKNEKNVIITPEETRSGSSD